MENEIVNLNVLFLNLNNMFQVLLTIYIPTINAAFDESMHQINYESQQTFQLSHILRETHTFDIFLTLTHINTIFSRKSEKIGSNPTFVLTLLFASKYSYLAESIAIK
jgi:hypothetical protein